MDLVASGLVIVFFGLLLVNIQQQPALDCR